MNHLSKEYECALLIVVFLYQCINNPTPILQAILNISPVYKHAEYELQEELEKGHVVT